MTSSRAARVRNRRGQLTGPRIEAYSHDRLLELLSLYVGEQPTRLQHTQPFTTGQVSDRPSAAYTASVAAADVRPTADQAWPFTFREYARLLLLSRRLRAQNRSECAPRPTKAMGTSPSGWTCLLGCAHSALRCEPASQRPIACSPAED